MTDTKKGTPCCNAAYELVYEPYHLKWLPDLKQWKCEKCQKEYCEKEMFDEES